MKERTGEEDLLEDKKQGNNHHQIVADWLTRNFL